MSEEQVRTHAAKYIRENYRMALATASKEAKPHAAIVNYVVDNQWNFYFLSRAKTQKTADILANQEASFVIGFDLPISVQGWGKAVKVMDNKERERAFALLEEKAEQHDSFWPLPLKVDRLNDMLVRIEPWRLRALVFGDLAEAGPDGVSFVDIVHRPESPK
jgi:nitroimidazol reductase NimA-like FMN-containing flavoprotein (pyridoxamine 5'-phosphate oxidase superfamily)